MTVRKTINVDGSLFCADITGSLPGNLTIANAIAGACAVDPPQGVPPGRQLRVDVGYSYTNTTPAYVKRNVDATSADELFGRHAVNDPATPFPWQNYYSMLRNFKQDGYIAAAFTVPENSKATLGIFTHTETAPGPNLDMAFSERPGDFSNLTFPNGRANVGPGASLGRWKTALAPANAVSFLFEKGKTYYINIRCTVPIPGGIVAVGVQSNHN